MSILFHKVEILSPSYFSSLHRLQPLLRCNKVSLFKTQRLHTHNTHIYRSYHNNKPPSSHPEAYAPDDQFAWEVGNEALGVSPPISLIPSIKRHNDAVAYQHKLISQLKKIMLILHIYDY